jgi:hypothetical protein
LNQLLLFNEMVQVYIKRLYLCASQARAIGSCMADQQEHITLRTYKQKW